MELDVRTREQFRSFKNEELKYESYLQEVKKCSRRNAQKQYSKNFTQMLRSRAIKKKFGDTQTCCDAATDTSRLDGTRVLTLKVIVILKVFSSYSLISKLAMCDLHVSP